MKHPASRILFAYWDALRRERAAPEAGELDPRAIRQILPDIVILEVDPHGAADIRLAGTRMCALFGRELKGEPFGGLWTASAAGEAQRCIDIVTDETAGLVSGLLGKTAQGATVNLELLLLPLRHQGRTHARLLGALSPATTPLWIGLHAVSSLATVSQRVIRTSARDPKVDPRDFAPQRRFVVHHGGRV